MMIFIWLIIGLGIYFLLKNNGSIDIGQRPKANAEEILKMRYAKGEIDEETFKKMITMLKD